MTYHEPVMLAEVLEHLKVNKGKKYIDATLGDGGHTVEILKLGGQVLGIDVDQNSLTRATQRISELDLGQGFTGAYGSFIEIYDLAAKHGFTQVDGILFDLGYSSSQLDRDESGLSFMQDQELDMRLDKRLGVTAADLVNALPEKALAGLIREYSDEKFASKIAHAIVHTRETKQIQTTAQLADLIKSVTPLGYEHGRINPATRTFQALRIAVNDELNNLKIALPRAAQLVLPGGRLVVISFHSLEDKLVKSFGQLAQPNIIEVTDGPIAPSATEVNKNPRARSAKLRVYEKTTN